jgi:hypothetical protein
MFASGRYAYFSECLSSAESVRGGKGREACDLRVDADLLMAS